MKILISGGAGFLGQRLARALVADGHEVRSLARRGKPQGDEAIAGVDYRQGDIFDPASLASAMAGVEVVFHCVGMISYDPRKAQDMQRINIEGTRLVAEAALKARVRRLVHTSSTAAIGVNYDPKKCLDENTPFNARALGMAYFDTKYDAEGELHKLRARGLDYVIVNPGSIIGAGDTRRYEQVYAGLIYKVNPRFLPPGGNNFVDIDDVVFGHIAAMKVGKTGERYILGGENLSFADLIIRVDGIIGRKPPWIRIPVWSMQIVAAILALLRIFGLRLHITPALVRQVGAWYLYVDSKKAERELGYKPRSIDQGLRETLDWLRAIGRIK